MARTGTSNDSRMAKKRQGKQKKGPKKQVKHPIRRIFKWVGILLLVGFLSGVALFAYYAKDAPAITQEKLKSDNSSQIYDKKGDKITSLGLENRTYVTSQNIPQQLKDAVVSVEDKHFYKEAFGVNPVRIVTAAVSNVFNRGSLQGASTLTQQLVKLSVFSTKQSDQTLKRKAQEALLAFKVEQKYSKEQILEYYINKVYMNFGQYGMETGSEYYYGKSLKKLSLAQTAFIAGLGQSPVNYNPYTHPAKAKARRDTVINAMLSNNKITASEAAEAKATPISEGLIKQSTEKNTSSTDKIIDSYLSSVIKEVKKRTGLNPYTSGMKIYTNLDLDAQKKLYKIVNDDSNVAFPDDKFQTAVTMTDPNTGKVLAQIGGRKTGDVKLAYNRATSANRSNGSTMKPMMDYGPAIEYLHASTATKIDDSAYNYPGTDIPLHDWDNQYLGVITMRYALEQSRNIPAIKMLERVGLSRGVSFLKGLGITLSSTDAQYSAGIGAPVSTEQEAAAYGAFANGGLYYKAYYVHKITTSDGVTTNYSDTGSRAMKSSTAYMITDMLKGVMTSGTGTGAKVSNLYEAGKTGSVNYSSDELKNNPSLSGLEKDSWFTGYTRKRVISVWTGYDKPLEDGLGATSQKLATRIYKELMSYVSTDLPNRDWVKPSTVIAKTVNGQRELFVSGSSDLESVTDESSSSSSESSSTSSTSSSISSSSSSESASSESSSSASSDYSSELSSSASSSSSESASTSTSEASSESTASSVSSSITEDKATE